MKKAKNKPWVWFQCSMKKANKRTLRSYLRLKLWRKFKTNLELVLNVKAMKETNTKLKSVLHAKSMK